MGLAGGPDGVAAGPEDDFAQIGRALTELQGDGPALLPRMYVVWSGPGSTAQVLSQLEQLAAVGVRWDMVLCYRDPGADIDAWVSFVGRVVAAHPGAFAALQVTGEANLTSVGAAADGAFPGARDALVRGVLSAAAAKREVGAGPAIGFAVAPNVDPAAGRFWADVRDTGGAEFAGALDYAGIDRYPDVFGPRLSVDHLPATVERLLRDFREHDLFAAGIPATVPIRVCESGWPTGPDRPESRQALVLEIVIRSVYALRTELNVTHWELFALRDADSSKDDLFHRFGVLRDDYSRKPAFQVLQRLFTELG